MRSFTSERRAESSVPLLQKFVQTDAEAGFIARADVMTPDLPSYPIVVEVTGHRDIASEAQDAVCAAVHAVLEGLRAAFGAEQPLKPRRGTRAQDRDQERLRFPRSTLLHIRSFLDSDIGQMTVSQTKPATLLQ